MKLKGSEIVAPFSLVLIELLSSEDYIRSAGISLVFHSKSTDLIICQDLQFSALAW